MTEPVTSGTFRKNGRCRTIGLACPPNWDCRRCTIPISIGLVHLTTAVAALSKTDDVKEPDYRKDTVETQEPGGENGNDPIQSDGKRH